MVRSGERLPQPTSEESSGEGWDELSKVAFQGEAKQPTLAERQEQSLAAVREWGDIYRDTEQDFAKYRAQADLSTPENRAKYEKTLVKYEDEIAWDWQTLRSNINAAKTSGAIKGLYEEAATSRVGGDSSVDPKDSIEAACGIFYQDRMAELVSRVDGGTLSAEDKQSQKSLLGQTWQKVSRYLDAVGDMELQHENLSEYERARKAAHNSMIEQLNNINDLARDYQVKPFTPRNFFDGNVPYNRYLDHNQSLRNRAEYDRDTVMNYFRTVFTRDFDRTDRETLRNSNLY